MKTKRKNSDERNDPLAKELNFSELELIAYGPGWKKAPARQRMPKLLKGRAGVPRKPTSAKSRGRRAA